MTLWRRLIQNSALIIVIILALIGLAAIINQSDARELVTGRTQESLLVICREDYDIEDLLFHVKQGRGSERLGYLKEKRRCGEYFARYKVLAPVSTYLGATIIQLLHDKGVGYSYTDSVVVAENYRYGH